MFRRQKSTTQLKQTQAAAELELLLNAALRFMFTVLCLEKGILLRQIGNHNGFETIVDCFYHWYDWYE